VNALYSLVRFSPTAAFVVELRADGIKVHAPKKLPAGFLSAVQERAQRAGLRSGVIIGKRQRGGLTLGFMGVPAEHHQPLLNVWHAHKDRYRG